MALDEKVLEGMARKQRFEDRLLGQWDKACDQWDTARDQGTDILTDIGNAGMTMGHLDPENAEGVARDSGIIQAVADATEAQAYENMLEKERSLYVVLDGLRAAVEAMESVAEAFRSYEPNTGGSGGGKSPNKSPNKQKPLYVTHDPQSFGGVLAEVAAMYRAQYEACIGIAEASDPDVVRLESPTVITLRNSVWLMEPMIERSKLEILRKIRRIEFENGLASPSKSPSKERRGL